MARRRTIRKRVKRNSKKNKRITKHRNTKRRNTKRRNTKRRMRGGVYPKNTPVEEVKKLDKQQEKWIDEMEAAKAAKARGVNPTVAEGLEKQQAGHPQIDDWDVVVPTVAAKEEKKRTGLFESWLSKEETKRLEEQQQADFTASFALAKEAAKVKEDLEEQRAGLSTAAVVPYHPSPAPQGRRNSASRSSSTRG